MEEAEGEKVEEVAKLAAMCTKLNGEDRPTMREVEMTLENLRGVETAVSDIVVEEEASASQTVWRRKKPPPAEPCPQAVARETGATGGRVRKMARKTRVSLIHPPTNLTVTSVPYL